MRDTSENTIERTIGLQRSYFGTHATKDPVFRIEQLKKFRSAIQKHEKAITEALWKDLHKCYEEAYLTEFSLVYSEIDLHIRNLASWAAPEKVGAPLFMFPSKGKIITEPLGCALILAPWNYPFQLLANPLVGAISAGCCAIVKPSPSVPHVSDAIRKMIAETFEENYIACIEGGREVNEFLFMQRFDKLFFTGSPTVGKVVMKAAAANLTPVTLELGGKSPCIVDKNADLTKAAKRIAWGKTINAGQTCIAPDYLFVHEDVKDELLKKIGEHFVAMYGTEPEKSEKFGRMVSDEAFARVSRLLKDGKIVFGGNTDAKERFIQPTIIDNIQPDFPIMNEEIFGPVLPVMTFRKLDEAIDFVNEREKPLALYYFGKASGAKKSLEKTSSGGACINDTLMHVGNHELPFGGVGNSGTGSYHCKRSFLAFSHQRSVLTTPTWMDFSAKYAPYKAFRWIKKLI